MKISSIDTGFFKLDGGAMFGIVPRRIWQRLNAPDESNLCVWAMRCLLIETGDRKILVDTGLGDKQDDKFRSFFEPHGEATLLGSLASKGVSASEITDVFLTHLHFDHCGGAVRKAVDGSLEPTFPNATYWSNEVHYQWAVDPNAREKASFLPENFTPLKDAGVLKFLDVQRDPYEWLPGLHVQFVNGHTEAMMLLHLAAPNRQLVYCADLIPSSYHIGLPYIMSYDIRPMDTLTEKTELLEEAVDKNWGLIFEHDPRIECCIVQRSESGRIVANKSGNLELC
ncbi:MAG: MBL fold metallo-hydrolase [Lewinellaceae bacterium]|nr:MBL fold metallo-hydrolase [Lewinellaceae bacterium]